MMSLSSDSTHASVDCALTTSNDLIAIHIIMATSTSANPHTAPNVRIEGLARKRKISAITFLSQLKYSLLSIEYSTL
jgi:hypothetical protein